MRKTTLLKGSFLIATLWAFGCANTETDVSRRGLDDTIDINGAGYASKEISEGNVFGKESEGLVENPLNKPSDDVLGKAGAYENLVYTVEPTEAKAYINEFIEFEVVIDTSGEDFKQNNSPAPRFVVVLERPADGNAVLIVDKSELFNKSEFPPTDTMAVLKPDSKNTMRFKVLTGSAYNQDDPMYWVNVWSADADMPAIAKINVKKPPQKSDYEKGNSDVSNTLETSDAMEENLGKSKLTSVNLVSDEAREQTILVDTEKTFTVKLDDAKCVAGETGGEDCEVKGEPICWTFVEHTETNDGDILSPAPDDDLKLEDKDGVQVGCGEADDKGEVQVKIETGGAYDARYYLNFFHAKAAPLTFQIDTYAMPDTLGEPGDGPTDDLNGDGIPDEGRDIEIPGDGFTKDPNTGKEQLTGCDAATFLDKLWTDDAIKDSILEQCSNPKLESMSSCSGGDCSSTDGKFKCRLTKEADGTLMLSTCDGDIVMVDLDGDGIADPVRVVVTDNGDGTYRIDGFDTDGDGKPDVAPDPCLYGSCVKDPEYKLLCQVLKDGAKPDDKKYKACTKVSAGIDEDLDVYLKLVNLDDEVGVSGKTLEAKIIRGALVSNNADFKDYEEGAYEFKEITDANGNKTTEPTPTLTLNTGSEGKTKAVFWTGTAYDSLYYIMMENTKAKTVMLPVNVINSVDIPTNPGDKPDDSVLDEGGEAVTPPSDMPDYVPDLGPLVMEVAPGLSTDISSPVIRTLGLKVVLKTDYEKTGKSNLIQHEKVWWKVTRGPSSANNGSLLHSKSETDTKGTAVNYFYTGTGYDALYYVSVFHPNVLDEDGNVEPVIFAITTTNNTGTVPGPEPGDPSLPEGETKCPDGYKLEKWCGENKEDDSIKRCPDNTNPKQKCVDEDGKETDPTTINGIDINPDLPQKACADGITDPCLKLSIVGNPYKRFQPGKIEKSQFKLEIHNDGEETPTVVPNEKLHFTLDKHESVNAALLSKKSSTDADGKASASFTTGSKVTTFKLNAMHPNINKDGNMVPVTVNVSIYDPSQEPSDITDKNIINVNVEDPTNISLYPGDSLEKVYYYIFPSDILQCGEDFIYSSASGRLKACEDIVAENKDNADNIVCDLTSEEKSELYATQAEVLSGKGNYTIYAVGTTSGGEPVASGCVSYQSFPSWTKPKSCIIDRNDFESDEAYEAKLEEIKDDPACTRVMNINVSMTKMPMVIDSHYETKTLVNIGPLVREGTELGDQIKAIVDKVNAFIGEDPADKLTESLTENIIFEKGNANAAAKCFEKAANDKNNKCRHKNDNKTASDYDVNLICDSWNMDFIKDVSGTGAQRITWDLAEDHDLKQYYNDCNCICADLYYWTAVNTWGSKIAKLAKKGLNSLLKKYLSRDALTDQICGVVDELQYITLVGELNLEANGTSYTGHAEYQGAVVPFLDKPFTLDAKVIEGRWQQAIVSDTGTQIAISKYALNFTYGELIYEIVGKLLGLDKEGNIDLLGSFCDKLPDINLLVVKLDSSTLGGLCKLGVDVVENKAVEFAASKYVSLSVTLDGAANFERGETEKATGAGYYAQLITNGQWEGTGTLGADKAEGKTPDDTINGLWVGARKGQPMPEFKYGNKSVDDFKAEHSVCRQLMSAEAAKEAENAVYNTNKACLGGSYSKDSRLTKHKCKLDACKTKKSIVVCDSDGKLNQQYANATAAEIIKAANRACVNDDMKGKTENDCGEGGNPEIINEGHGRTNAQCIDSDCSVLGCENNPSIFVCDGIELSDACTDSETGKEMETSECYQVRAQDGCIGQCDEPGCLMNSEVAKCQASKDSKEEMNGIEKLAEWNFEKFVNGKEHDDGDITKTFTATPDEKIEVIDGFKLQLVDCSDYTAKMVLGPDGKLGAFGTDAISADTTATDCRFELTVPADAYQYTSVAFQVMGADRNITYQVNGGTPSGSVDGSGTEWRKVNFELSEKPETFKLNIYMTAPKNFIPAKMMRLDNIEVWGKKK